MSLVSHAKRELALLSDTDDEMQVRMNNHILQIVEEFEKEEHAGISAKYAISILTKLLNFEPLTPLTGEDDEWDIDMNGIKQNNRCSAVFQGGTICNGNPYYIYGNVFSRDNGETWFINPDSCIEIEFPFMPTTPTRIILPIETANYGE